MFNIFLNDLFFILKDTDICNFADDTSPQACDISLNELFMRLKYDSALAVCWFESNYTNLNTDNCHLIISGNKHECLWADIGNERIWESSYVKFLGLNIDRSLKFDLHMLKVCSKGNSRLTILSKVFKFLTFKKRKVLIKTYFESQFKYFPLGWMSHGRKVNNKINRLHEDSTSSFDPPLGKICHFLPMIEYSTTCTGNVQRNKRTSISFIIF